MPADIRDLPREEFIEKNLGLVHACAGRFKGRGIEYEELYAAGCLGHPTQPTITLMVSLPTEETAHECADAFPTMSAVVRDAILALLDGAQLP